MPVETEHCVLVCNTNVIKIELKQQHTQERKADGRKWKGERRDVAITMTLTGDEWCYFQSTGTCLFFYHSLFRALEAIHFPYNSCPKCKQYFGYEARKCFILCQVVARTLQKDPLKIKHALKNVLTFSCWLQFVMFLKTQNQVMKCISRKNIIKSNLTEDGFY